MLVMVPLSKRILHCEDSNVIIGFAIFKTFFFTGQGLFFLLKSSFCNDGSRSRWLQCPIWVLFASITFNILKIDLQFVGKLWFQCIFSGFNINVGCGICRNKAQPSIFSKMLISEIGFYWIGNQLLVTFEVTCKGSHHHFRRL